MIALPDWFGALNKDYYYQLTAIGTPGPNLYVAEEITSDTATTRHSSRDDVSINNNSNNNNNRNRFKIAGGKSGTPLRLTPGISRFAASFEPVVISTASFSSRS